MLRTFPEHFVRLTQTLDGLWDFFPACDGSFRGKLPAHYTRKMEVPGVWESLPDLRRYRGTGWFRREITLAETINLRLAFGGVSHTGTVFLDGKEVGRHYDAFTPWDVVVPAVKAGVHDIVIQVDNSFGPHSALHIPNDYYTYGGITRPLEMQAVSDLFIDKLLARPRRRAKDWELEVRVRLRNIGRSAQVGTVTLSCAEGSVEIGPVELGPGAEGEFIGRLKGLEVEPWTPETPRLYFLNAELVRDGVILDDKIDRVGFREVNVRGKKVLLNGKALRLRGFNRHEDMPIHGCAMSTASMAHDLDLFRDLHANFLRTSHYPNDQRLLDMCDERGLLVWEESHARQTPFDAPLFREQIRQSTIEMVEQHYNHPSIILWGSLNECESESEDGYKVHAEVLGLLRSLDSSRPITYASHLQKRDICHGLADVVSWNHYTGWYSMAPEKVGEALDEMIRWLDSDESRGGKGKPLIMSEFGAGAVPGWRHPHGDVWTEEGQAHILDKSLEVYLHHPRIMGAAIWQFCDIRVSAERNGHPKNSYDPMGRPRCMNNKGIVDEYRRPKLAYQTVRMRFIEAETQEKA
jgi:beta-glucuronidase